MFIDSDIEFSGSHIFRMIAKDRDITCGIYPKKTFNIAKLAQLARARPDLTREQPRGV